MTQEVKDMRVVLDELAKQDLAIYNDGSMTWKPRADPTSTITVEQDGGWRFERDGVSVRKGKAENGTTGFEAAIAAYLRWIKMWAKRRELREAQEALHSAHCVPKQFLGP